MRHNYNERGITLIALIITIIILVILAAVSIRAVYNMSIVGHAINGTQQYAERAKEENKMLGDTVNVIESTLGKLDNIQNGKGSGESGNSGAGNTTNALAEFQTETTKPYMPSSDFTHVTGTSLTNGLVIEDTNVVGLGNQFVWIEVPRTTGNTGVYKTAGLNIKGFSDTELEAIKTDLIAYATTYRESSYSDTYSSGCGLADETAYNNLYKKMLKSVYENGGFWIGRYETGYAYDDPAITAQGGGLRTYGTDYYTEHPTTHKAIIKANAYPYNWVRQSQAQSLSSGIHSGECESSLLFGIQWDLVLRYLESKGVTQAELRGGDATGSSNWGNYSNVGFDVKNANAKYTTDFGANWSDATTYEKPSSSVLLTTGANETRNSKQNICDLAGNVQERTLENETSVTSDPYVIRGGNYFFNGSNNPACYRRGSSTTNSSYTVGFRVTLFK